MSEFATEEVRHFLDQMHSEMKGRYAEQLPAAMTLFDAIMEPGARCEASKEVFRQWFANLFFFAVEQTLLDRGRTFLGVEVVREQDEPEEKEEKPEPTGFYSQ